MNPVARLSERLAQKISRRRHKRRLESLHTRLVPPARMTLSHLQAASACLGLDPDDVLSGRLDGEPKPPSMADAQRFLDLTHPGHGLALSEMDSGDAMLVAGVAAANFTMAPLMLSLLQSGAWPTSKSAQAASYQEAAVAGEASS